jgi:hypothetical protein
MSEPLSFHLECNEKPLLPIITDIVEGNGCKVDKTSYRSTYNSYVVYDYEPFCSDGFKLEIIVSGTDKNTLKFVKHLINSHLRITRTLNNILKDDKVRA